jgi:cation transport protein ChaC
MTRFADLPSPPAVSAFVRWSEEKMAESIEATLQSWAPGRDVWIFGYGSLIWRPEFDFTEKRPAHIQGFHRALCLWSRINRGTPEVPGLVFGLEQSGTCQGMVFRVAAEHVRSTFSSVWKREMGTGAYHPTWLECMTPDGPVQGLAFVINQAGPAYVNEPPQDALIEIILRARGTYGTCLEYVTQTADALDSAGIHDPRLMELVRCLRQLPSRS